MSPKALERLLWVMGLGLIVGALVMANLAIMYSSEPNYQQQGWAIFCGLNAIWVLGLGVICIFTAGSSDLEFRQLDYDRQREKDKEYQRIRRDGA